MNMKWNKLSVVFEVFGQSPGSEPPSLHPLSVHRFPTLLSIEKHPKPGHSTCDGCRSHPRLSVGKSGRKMTEWKKEKHLWTLHVTEYPLSCRYWLFSFLHRHPPCSWSRCAVTSHLVWSHWRWAVHVQLWQTVGGCYCATLTHWGEGQALQEVQTSYCCGNMQIS